MSVTDPASIFVWIVFYLIIIGLFYWCFRQSMIKLANQASQNVNDFDDVERDLAAHHQRHRRHHHRRPRHHHNARHRDRAIYSAGQGHNVYFITESGRPSNASSDSGLHERPPPEYKWEDLPPTYDEAVRSYTNVGLPEDEPVPGTSSFYAENQTSTSTDAEVRSECSALGHPTDPSPAVQAGPAATTSD